MQDEANKVTPERFLREKNLVAERFIPFSRATLWRRVGEGKFPQPIRMHGRITAWRQSEVVAWQLAQIGGAAS